MKRPLNVLIRCHPSYNVTFLAQKGWPPERVPLYLKSNKIKETRPDVFNEEDLMPGSFCRFMPGTSKMDVAEIEDNQGFKYQSISFRHKTYMFTTKIYTINTLTFSMM